MRKNFYFTAYAVFACLVIALGLLFYLTQRNYDLLKSSNQAVINTGKIIRAHEQLSGDFKNVLIYVSTFRESARKKQYEDIYGIGLWQISIDMSKLQTLLDTNRRRKMDSLSKLMDVQVSWMMHQSGPISAASETVDEHIRKISEIQSYLDNQEAELERISIANVIQSNNSLASLHNWFVAIIIASSIIILLALIGIYLQFHRLENQNRQLRDIAWIQSHEVRSQVAILLGLGEVLNHHAPDDPDHSKILAGIMSTTKKLDEIVHEINRKAEM